MGAQICAECQVSFDLRIVLLIDVQVMRPILASIFGEVTATGKPIFAPGLVTSRLKLRCASIKALNAPNDRKQVNDRFGR